MTEEYITQFSEYIEGRIPKKLSQVFSRTDSRILGALSEFDQFLLNRQIRIYSVAVPSRNNNSENREPTGDGPLNDPCPDEVISTCRTSDLNDSDQEETYHSQYSQ